MSWTVLIQDDKTLGDGRPAARRLPPRAPGLIRIMDVCAGGG